MRRIKLTAFLWVIRFINFCSPVLLSWVFLDCNVAVNLMLHGHLPERHQHGSPEKSWKSICSAASICPQNLVPGCIWCNLVILGGSCSSVWCQTFNIGLRNPRPLMSCPISLSVCKHLHTETHCESVVYLDNLGQTRSFILCWWSFWTTTTQRLRLFFGSSPSIKRSQLTVVHPVHPNFFGRLSFSWNLRELMISVDFFASKSSNSSKEI